ncbi:MAG: hypothetical protein O3A21_07425 [Proteobacteria bacterium]|nr:hypothetical protein [Pseudomonadota bacterium]
MTSTAPPRDRKLSGPLRLLAERDPDFAVALKACGLPPVRQQPTGFEGLLSIILAQQVSAGATRAIRERLYTAVGDLTPQSFLALDDEALRAIGFSRQKVRYGRGIAEVTLSGALDFDAVAGMDDAEAIG